MRFFTSLFGHSCAWLVLGATLFLTGAVGAPLVASLNGSAVVFGAGTYPRATRLSDGTLLGTYTAGSSKGETIIKTCKSTDNGVTWTDLGNVFQGVGDISNSFLLQLPTGRVLCAYRDHTANGTTANFNWRLKVSSSDDNGATWKFLSEPVMSMGPKGTGSWEPFMRLSEVDPSTVQFYYSHENAGNDQDTLLITSTDGGATWSNPPTTVSGGGITVRDGMVSVARLPNSGPSSLICVFEAGNVTTNTFSLGAVTSSDDGKTWENRHTVYVPTGERNNAGAPQVVLVGDTLTVSFMTDEDTSLHNWTHGAGVKLLTSADGENFGHKVNIFPVQTNWAGQLALGNTSVLVMGDHGGSKAQKVGLS